MAQQHHVFGIRHHEFGSARALLNALNKLQPDCVLVEGPPDANDLLHWAGHAEMEPPVALLIYRPDQPSKAAFYLYADFSAEFQAIRYAVERSIPVRFIDLPVANRMASDAAILPPNADVMQQLGAAAGYGDYEQWWNAAVEQRRDTTDLFDGILDLMTLLRASAEITSHTNEGAQLWADRREAAMRNGIRIAIANGYQHIAVVVGAWHARHSSISTPIPMTISCSTAWQQSPLPPLGHPGHMVGWPHVAATVPAFVRPVGMIICGKWAAKTRRRPRQAWRGSAALLHCSAKQGLIHRRHMSLKQPGLRKQSLSCATCPSPACRNSTKRSRRSCAAVMSNS